ncbi:uncharacterized protein LOC127262565 [Andrographis paniculata]|uniref:uncharacterized protein LOC127262565 n=1 Tax=Andrographis paniculata TaxID=175694 RepID=UPI0021E78ECC|nr:uncharacterized protein LOC127262565 [Andrographis paniculata]XP_051147258.1 uncharacterized protein LOC127262565 [Andrographis paniculata]
MGAACCVAAKDRTITSGSPGEILQRHTRYSPSWSFRWDNRGRVAGEDAPASWLNDGGYRVDHVEFKSGACASEEGSPLDSFRSLTWQKSPFSERNAGILRLPSSDRAISRNVLEVKEPTDSPNASYPSPIKFSPSVSSVTASPLSSQSHPVPPNSTPSRLHRRSPGHRFLCQVSDSRIPEYKSPTFSISEEPPLFLTANWGNDSTRGSNGGSSDSWSVPGFSEFMSLRRERWSFDSETSVFNRDKISRFSGGSSRSHSFDLQTCGICSKLLTERLAVVSVLTCGHVYHAECLEYMTPEINKFDPACPVCTFGEKRAAKMSEKSMKAELDSKARKRFRKRILDLGSNAFDRRKGWIEEKSSKTKASSSMKSSSSSPSGGKPFLKRHLSFCSRTGNRSMMSEKQSVLKRGLFWTRSSKQ